MIVIAANHHGVDAAFDDFGKAIEHQPFGIGGRGHGVEQIACHQQAIDALTNGDIQDLGHHLLLLVKPRSATQRLAHVPVAGVQKSHFLMGPGAVFLAMGFFGAGGSANAYHWSSPYK